VIHRQNSYAPRNRRCTGGGKAQSREPVNKVKKKRNTRVSEFGLISSFMPFSDVIFNEVFTITSND
jgi:hypothetical protein